jgi:hypothetical protein
LNLCHPGPQNHDPARKNGVREILAYDVREVSAGLVVMCEPRISLPIETNRNDLASLKRTASRMLASRGGMLFVKDENGEAMEVVG